MEQTSNRITQTAEVPGPKGIPLLGVLPQVRQGALQFFIRAAMDYGGLVRLEMGPKRFYLACYPDYIKYVLQDNNKNFNKGYGLTRPLLGDGLVSAEGEHWRKQRRLIQPLFNRAHLANFANVMIDQTAALFERWSARPNPSQPLDVAAEMMTLTQSIIVRTMFNTPLGSEGPQISRAFTTALEYFNTILFSPIRRLDRFPTPCNLRFQRAMQYLDSVVYRMIAERRRSREEVDDLLSLLVNAKDEETGQGMPDRQIRDELMTIFLAGHETTATLLAWTWYLLSLNPDIDRRVRREVSEVIGSRTPTVEDLSDLLYTRMMLDEVLRLYPPAWMFARRLNQDDEIAGYHLPAGAMLMLSPYVTHHLPEFWQNPEGFDPERFCPERIEGRPRFSYFPFGGGPRQCIGNNFALMEAHASSYLAPAPWGVDVCASDII
jgi:cytochrome P450